MAYMVMAYTVMASIVMAYIVMAYIVMAWQKVSSMRDLSVGAVVCHVKHGLGVVLRFEMGMAPRRATEMDTVAITIVGQPRWTRWP